MTRLQRHQINSDFEKAYLSARSVEDRLLSLDTIESLPYPSSKIKNYYEWKKRQHSFELFKDYFDKWNPKTVLDLACGNGWLINRLYNANIQFTGIEINEKELEQASELLKGKENTILILADVFKLKLDQRFDCIIVSAAIQYFDPLEKIMDRLISLLSNNGELHIFDSPFYVDAGHQRLAKDRSEKYFKSIGTPSMTKFYHHHLVSTLEKYDPEYLYDPKTIINRFKSKFLKYRNPFPWVKIVKNQ